MAKTKLENQKDKTMEARYWCLEVFETAKKLANEKEELEGEVEQLKSNIKQYMDMVGEEKKKVGRSDSSGLRTLQVGAFGSIKCYVIVLIQGLPHVESDFGVYQVDQEFLDTENVLILNKEGSDDESEE